MATCDNNDRLLELLYGLLDENETAQLRVHLQTCAQCQAALKEAEEHKRLFSQAAMVCGNIPPFAPSDFSGPVAAPATLSQPMPTSPLPSPRGKFSSPTGRASRWRLYFLAGVAASVLLAVVLANSYKTGLDEREGQVAESEKKITGIDAQFAAARASFEEQQKKLAPGRRSPTLMPSSP